MSTMSTKAYLDRIMNSAAVQAMMQCVRTPASFCRLLRSNPTSAPSPADSSSRTKNPDCRTASVRSPAGTCSVPKASQQPLSNISHTRITHYINSMSACILPRFSRIASAFSLLVPAKCTKNRSVFCEMLKKMCVFCSRYTPGNVDNARVSDYNTSIRGWCIPAS